MRKKRLLAYIIMVVSLSLSVNLVKDIYRLWHADDRLAVAERELLIAKERQVELNFKLRESESADWWEKQVRNTLKMARPNEVVVIVPDEVSQSTASRDLQSQALIESGTDLTNLQKWRRVFIY